MDRRGARFPTNRGELCQKGWTAAELLSSPGRLRVPLVRDGVRSRYGLELEPCLGTSGQGHSMHTGKYGRDAVGVFGDGSLTKDLLGKFARAAAGLKAFGLDRGLPFPLADIPQASD